MFENVKDAIDHFKFYSSGAMDNAAIHRIEAKIAQFVIQTGVWSLDLAMALDEQNWDIVSEICGQINKAYCDSLYQEKQPKLL